MLTSCPASMVNQKHADLGIPNRIKLNSSRFRHAPAQARHARHARSGSLHKPKAGENAGFGRFKRPQMPYDRFMEAEGIPVYRAIGVRRVQDLPLAPWKRLGGRGSYIQLYGTEGLWGLYVVELPSAGALNVERHLYEKVVLVVEGRGTTEEWQEGQTKRHAFEWQKGSLFSIPLNAMHRFINAASSPALMLCGTSAPNVMNLIDNPAFIFN